MSQIRYFIPEDGDSEQDPNVFLAPKPTRPGYPPTLGQIKAAFPLPGKYHFRFKTTLVPGYDKGPVVWMDAVDNEQPVGLYQNAIVAKVTRVSFNNDEDDTEEEDDFRASELNAYQNSRAKEASRVAPVVPVPAARTTHAYARSAPPSVSNTPNHTPRATPIPVPVASYNGEADLLGHGFDDVSPRSQTAQTSSFLDGFDDGLSSAPAIASVSSPDTLLDMTHATSSGDHDFFGGATASAHQTNSVHHNDFLGMHVPAPTPQPPQQQQQPRPYAQPNMMMNGGGYGQPQRPLRAPSSGNSKKSNAFDSFSQNVSPFADFGNFA